MKALHFGAGNIGKGFIGYVLNKNGYDVCFVDINQKMVNRFNRDNSYVVELLDDSHTVETISPVTALNSVSQEDEVIEAIVNADLITTSVGVNNLSRIASIVSKGLVKRAKENKRKIDIIANENAINPTSILKQEIEKHVTISEMLEIHSFVGFPNSAIDRLSLSKDSEEGEIALVEPMYEWIINKSEMVNGALPVIKGAIYVEDLRPYIERKLYIVNMGHATTAYIGFLTGKSTIQSALANPNIEYFVKETLNEAAQYIIRTFDIPSADMSVFIEKTMKRFKNKNVSDDILRVGRSPIRKIGYDERLLKPTRELFGMGLSIEYLSMAVAAAFLYDDARDEEAVSLQKYINEKGIEQAIEHFTQTKNKGLTEKIKEKYDLLKTKSTESMTQLME
ncbi:mannitol-1-phosphate 5-dehydrogenase [Peribacillus muralis]|uniref:mannitol-1-phosphate 5-dehydrogenase n=1 Tax=Peribacillus muralis TaxID=264697 RepID=UPI001F4E1AA5|nr:mannitol-1-phosphate 5-dehydrogenase [Peribacillus muralis]MCK1991184.1 mannitol-1-phosphate 5-dehydrogenase [Peribacillus muralis]MCK2011738.1 mannitol-1-phosphate 5-dehydrogenase [Peribacillus muralis]